MEGNSQSAQIEKKPHYYPSLDGLRAIAAVVVFLHHYRWQGSFGSLWEGGWIGVDLFFVLSGFLITGILYDSKQASHRLSSFYARRALRIFPLYYGVMLFLLALTPFLKWKFEFAQILWPLHLGNYARFLDLHPAHPLATDVLSAGLPSRNVYISHFWSLCIEEQFYLIWPCVVYKIADRRRLLQICIGVLVLTPLIRLAVFLSAPKWLLDLEIIYRTLPTRMDALIFGALLALLLRGPERAWLKRWRRPVVLSGVLPFVAVVCFQILKHRGLLPPSQNAFIVSFGYTALDLAAAVILLDLIHDESFPARILRNRYLRSLGVISYGFYILHDLPHCYYLTLAKWISPHHVTRAVPPIAFLGTLSLSILSYRYFETPFLKLKRKFPNQVHKAPQL